MSLPCAELSKREKRISYIHTYIHTYIHVDGLLLFIPLCMDDLSLFSRKISDRYVIYIVSRI